MDKAKEDWIRRVAKEGEVAVNGRASGSCSKYILDVDQPALMQSGRRMER